MKRGMVDKCRESLWLPAIGTWRYPIRAYKWLGAMSVMFPVCKAPGPHFSISEEFLHSIIFRPKKPWDSWNLVNLLLSMNEVWMDECVVWMCCQITFTIEKFQDLIVTSDHVLWTKKSLKKNNMQVHSVAHFAVHFKYYVITWSPLQSPAFFFVVLSSPLKMNCLTLARCIHKPPTQQFCWVGFEFISKEIVWQT